MRVILVPLVGDDQDRAALTAAFAIAQAFRSHVDGLFVRPELLDAIADLEGGSPEVLGSVTRATTAEWNGLSGRAKQAFEAARASAGAVLAEQPTATDAITAHWREKTGSAETIVPEAGRLADLVVFAGIAAEGDRQRRTEFEAALIGAARPLLLVPRDGAVPIGKTIALAWNGSAEATRALAGAMPLLRRADAVHVLSAAGARTGTERADALARYLAWHGLACDKHALYPESSTGAALLARTKEIGADLLVMGGYGHSRVREMIFGGVTRHVLRHHDLPVLISH